MSLTVSRDRVKARCGETDSTHDAAIDALIAELVPVLESALRPDALASTDAGLVAWLNLCATDVVCGEWLAMRLREPSAADIVEVGGLRVEPFVGKDPSDPFGLAQRGWTRLGPYLAFDRPSPTLRGVVSASGKQPEEPA